MSKYNAVQLLSIAAVFIVLATLGVTVKSWQWWATIPAMIIFGNACFCEARAKFRSSQQ